VARFPEGLIYEVEEDVKSNGVKEYEAENSSRFNNKFMFPSTRL
jgi:hypothetical protein